MSRKGYTPEQIFSMLREAEVALSQGRITAQGPKTRRHVPPDEPRTSTSTPALKISPEIPP